MLCGFILNVERFNGKGIYSISLPIFKLEMIVTLTLAMAGLSNTATAGLEHKSRTDHVLTIKIMLKWHNVCN